MDHDLRELYQEVILDHGKNPRNFRQPEDANCEAHGNNPLCGDRLTVYLEVENSEFIRDAAFEGRGCAISMASALATSSGEKPYLDGKHWYTSVFEDCRSSGVMPPSPVVVLVPIWLAALPIASLVLADKEPKLMPAMVMGISNSIGCVGRWVPRIVRVSHFSR